MALFISIAIAMFAGVMMTRVTKLFNMPDVTAYLIAGILIGPCFLGRIGIEGLGFTSYEAISNLDLISSLALGFIAFAIGTEFMLPKLRKVGKQAVIIGLSEALTAVVFVTGILLILYFILPGKVSLPMAILMGAIASATAPAATLLVVRQFKAKGAVTEILLPVVALDDAIALVCFAIASGIVKGLLGGEIDIYSIVINPIIQIFMSLVLGAVFGFILAGLERWFNSNKNRMIFIVSGVMVTTALSMLEIPVGPVKIGFSSLLVCMMLGTIFCNACPVAEEMMERADKWTSPLYCLFFVLSGASLRFDMFSDVFVVIIGVIYIVFRALGKYVGASVSARLVHCRPQVNKYLGFTLFPQAGVALGMSLTASQILGETGTLVRSLTLFAVLVYELIGPTITKIALTKSGDIQPKSEEVLKRREKVLKEIQDNRSSM
ncbi:MAG: cation:proton antiporter [Parasporobacterium sp.]|nr:cation:proton antiporter [Parasporobacterium sp.]